MKKIIIIASLLISSYTFAEKAHTPEQIEEINGIVYDLESGEPFTGELTFTDDNNKRDVLYLIYGHDFSHRVMNYENGKLNSMSSYVDQGGNPVLLEWYEDGVLTFQYSAAHEAKDRGINYSDLCKPAAEPGGWRSCGHIKFSEQEEGVSK